jgi:hypothetical protein
VLLCVYIQKFRVHHNCSCRSFQVESMLTYSANHIYDICFNIPFFNSLFGNFELVMMNFLANDICVHLTRSKMCIQCQQVNLQPSLLTCDSKAQWHSRSIKQSTRQRWTSRLPVVVWPTIQRIQYLRCAGVIRLLFLIEPVYWSVCGSVRKGWGSNEQTPWQHMFKRDWITSTNFYQLRTPHDSIVNTIGRIYNIFN